MSTGAQLPNNQTTARVSQIWRGEYFDKLTGGPFNPKPKSATAIGSSDLPVDLQWSTRASPNVNSDEAPGDRVPDSAATQSRWSLAEALVNEHGRVARAEWAYTMTRTDRATKPRWPNNDEVSADGMGEANGASDAARGQQRIRCSAKRCHQYWCDASR